ncbi:WYL domain-containing protein [Kordiimonas sediminis]|uniref:WYL domain-containing protein n=1 Tax=Kordiimonas sediminis TaxID=1735581 RepID=A0A919ALG4_9PROT|nr:WYL domain-containing protein [Kordiimonas sediminis]GHF12557.1 WYL domain-containing protein [Kordiimonas sediminis]
MRFEKLMQVLDLALEMQARHMGLSLNDIKDKLDVSHRTAQRIVRGLETVFPQLEQLEGEDREYRWRLPAGSLNGFLNIEAEEVAALEIAAVQLTTSGRQVEAEKLNSLEQKLRVALRSDVRRRIEPDLEVLMQAEGLIAIPGPKRAIPAQTVKTIRQAIMAGTRILIRYRKREGEEADYKLDPYGFLYGHRHYLIAFKPEGGEDYVRKFRLGDILSVTLLNEPFTRLNDFNLQEYSDQSFGVFADGPFDAEWLFTKEAADTAADYVFHPSQTIARNQNGSLTVKFRAGGLQEMAWHLVIWGENVEVIKPVELVEMMKNQMNQWDTLP